MDSGLDAISDPEWERLARAGGYRASTLAGSVNVSRQHLGLFFRLHFKLPPKAWLDRLKMQDAYQHLRKGEPVKGFYDELGFRHPNDFSRAFRRLTKRHPTAARVPCSVPSPEDTHQPSAIFQKAPKCSKRLRANVCLEPAEGVKGKPTFHELVRNQPAGS